MSRILCITSGKGGAGKSTVVSNLGRCLARDGARVLLIDADVTLRSLDLMLDVAQQTVYHWMDVITGRCQLQQAILDVPGERGLYVLPAPTDDSALGESDRFSTLCRSLGNAFDFVLIDCPAGLGEGFRLAVAPADEIFIVTTPDAVCVRSAGITNDLLSTLNKRNVRLIINRFQARPVEHGIFANLDGMIDQVGAQLIGIVPEDPDIVLHAAQGKPLPGKKPAAQAFDNIAARLQGHNVPLLNAVLR